MTFYALHALLIWRLRPRPERRTTSRSAFWFDEISRFYFVIDEKPKKSTGLAIKRMRNIAENLRVTMVVDHYEEDWASLAYVLVHGPGGR